MAVRTNKSSELYYDIYTKEEIKMKGKYLIPVVIILLVCTTLGLASSNTEAEPNADFIHTPQVPRVNDVVTFDASGSFGKELTYIWDFGDGHKASGEVVRHSYKEPGEYIVILVIADAGGGIDTYNERVYVEDDEGFWWIGIVFAYCCFIFFIMIFWTMNPIIGGILAYKIYDGARKKGRMETAKPYLLAHLIAGIIGIFLWPMVLFAIIAHVVIYKKFRNRMKKMDVYRRKKKRNKSSRPPRKTRKPPRTALAKSTPEPRDDGKLMKRSNGRKSK